MIGFCGVVQRGREKEGQREGEREREGGSVFLFWGAGTDLRVLGHSSWVAEAAGPPWGEGGLWSLAWWLPPRANTPRPYRGPPRFQLCALSARQPCRQRLRARALSSSSALSRTPVVFPGPWAREAGLEMAELSFNAVEFRAHPSLHLQSAVPCRAAGEGWTPASERPRSLRVDTPLSRAGRGDESLPNLSKRF